MKNQPLNQTGPQAANPNTHGEADVDAHTRPYASKWTSCAPISMPYRAGSAAWAATSSPVARVRPAPPATAQKSRCARIH